VIPARTMKPDYSWRRLTQRSPRKSASNNNKKRALRAPSARRMSLATV
jgi:hypothetical protein